MKKTFARRITSVICAAFAALIVCTFGTVSASAADIAVSNTAIVAMADTADTETKPEAPVINMPTKHMENTPSGASKTGNSGSSTADTTYKTVIEIFITWFQRIGFAIAFIGAIMFAIGFKDDDSESKKRGLLTMCAGFIVAAVCIASDKFDLFT